MGAPQVVTFSYGMEAQGSATCTVALGSEPLPFRGLYHVLLSMKAVSVSVGWGWCGWAGG